MAGYSMVFWFLGKTLPSHIVFLYLGVLMSSTKHLRKFDECLGWGLPKINRWMSLIGDRRILKSYFTEFYDYRIEFSP